MSLGDGYGRGIGANAEEADMGGDIGVDIGGIVGSVGGVIVGPNRRSSIGKTGEGGGERSGGHGKG